MFQTWIPVYTNKIHVYYPYWLSWLMTELSSGVYYKLVVPQYVKRQEEVMLYVKKVTVIISR